MVEREELEPEYKEIVDIVQKGVEEVKSIVKERDEAKEEPKKLRAEYDACIDVGDRKGADKALDKIAAAQKKLSDMPDRYVDLRVIVPTLYERQQKVHSKTCELIKKKEKQLKAAEEDLGLTIMLSRITGALKANIDKLAGLIPPKKE